MSTADVPVGIRGSIVEIDVKSTAMSTIVTITTTIRKRLSHYRSLFTFCYIEIRENIVLPLCFANSPSPLGEWLARWSTADAPGGIRGSIGEIDAKSTAKSTNVTITTTTRIIDL